MHRETPETIDLLGGTVCLDFANSVDRSDSDQPVNPAMTDVLTEPDWLARWGRRTGVLGRRSRPLISPAELARARRLREALYASFAAVSRDQTPGRVDLELIARTNAEATDAARLVRAGAAWRLSWADGESAIRFAVAADAVRLLGDADRLGRVRRCPGRDCGWLFVNASGRRHWCSMSSCGSREKMRRMYARRHPGSAQG